MVTRISKIDNPWESFTDQAGRPSNFVNVIHSPEGSNGFYRARTSDNADTFDKYAIPPKELTSELIQDYFLNAGMLFPYIHQATFLDTYSQLIRYGPRRVQTTWLGLFNMILAVATNMIIRCDSQSNERATEAQVYYERAVSLCDKHILSGSSLEIGWF